MNRRRSILLALIAVAAIALVALPGHFGGSYASFTDHETISGSVSSGVWLATITIEKRVDEDSATDFDFTVNVPGCDEDETLKHGQSFSCTFDARGETGYTVEEEDKDGWQAPVISCGEDDHPGISTGDHTLTFDLEPGDHVSCVFTNAPNSATVTVSKAYSPASPLPDPATVSITLSCTTGTPGSPQDAAPGRPAVFTVTGIPDAGTTCTATEPNPLIGYTPSGCTTFAVSANQEDAACTITNTRDTGTIVIKKAALGGDETFDFTSTGEYPVATFTLATDSGAASSGPVTVNTGDLTITEVAETGWSYLGLTCVQTAGDGASTYPASSTENTASITLAKGDTIECTFTNSKHATLTVSKTYDRANGVGEVSVTVTGCSVLGDATKTTPASFMIQNIPAAGVNCTVTEDNTPTGYTPSYSEACSAAILPGATATCVVTNVRDTGSVTISKDADAADTFGFDLTALTNAGGTCPTSSITVSAAPFDGSITCTGVPTGNYSISENTPPPGWSFDTAQCGSESAGTTPSVSVTVAKDQTATCTFTNTRDTGTIIIRKQTNIAPPSGATSFAFQVTDNANGGAVVASATLEGSTAGQAADAIFVPTGAYTVTETSVLTGWSFTSVTCGITTPASGGESIVPAGPITSAPSAGITVAKGETVTCTFVNTLDLATEKLFLSMSPSNTLVVSDAAGSVTITDGTSVTWQSAVPRTVASSSGWSLSVRHTGPSNFQSTVIKVDVWVSSGSCAAVPASNATNYVAGTASHAIGGAVPQTVSVPLTANADFVAPGVARTICLQITNIEGNSGVAHRFQISGHADSFLEGPY